MNTQREGRPLAQMALFIRWAVTVLCGALMVAASARAQSRGELLYSTHCIACHTAQVHWRDQRVATDWASLKSQVRRWQGVASLAWNEDDVLEVTRHLNDSIYRFERAPGPLSLLGRRPAAEVR